MKGKASVLGMALGIPVSLVAPLVGLTIYIAVAGLWFIPDRRMERALGRTRAGD